MFCPADFLHSSPSPHFKSLKSFYIFFSHCPCCCSIQHHTPYQCLYHPYLQCRGATKGGWRVLKHPQLKKGCPAIRPNPMTFPFRGVCDLHGLALLLFNYYIL